MTLDHTTRSKVADVVGAAQKWALDIVRGKASPIDYEALSGQTVGYIANVAGALDLVAEALTQTETPVLLRDDDLTGDLDRLTPALAEELAETRARSDAEHGWAVGRGLTDVLELVARLSDKVDSVYAALEAAGVARAADCACTCSCAEPA